MGWVILDFFLPLGCARRYRLGWVAPRGREGGGGGETSRSAEMHAACVRVVYSPNYSTRGGDETRWDSCCRWFGLPSGGYRGSMPDHLHLMIMVACMRTGAVRVDVEVGTGSHTEQFRPP